MKLLIPTSEEVICTVPRGRAEDIDAACKAAHAALQGPWADLTPFERGRMLFKLADLIESNIDRLSYLERIDVGKPVSEARGDVMGVANCFSLQCRRCRQAGRANHSSGQ